MRHTLRGGVLSEVCGFHLFFVRFCGFCRFFVRFLCGFAVSIVAYRLRFPTGTWCDFSVFGHFEMRFCGFCRPISSVSSFFKSIYDFFDKNNRIRAVSLSILVLRFFAIFLIFAVFAELLCGFAV